MPKKIKIPVDIEEVGNRLAVLDGIATATEWERAALVYAHTYDAPRGRPPVNARHRAFTIAGFAALKYAGLHKRDTVATYRNIWKEAVDSGAVPEVGPGDSIPLPEIDWPTTRTGTDGFNTVEGAQKTIDRIIDKHGPAIIAKQVEKDEVAEEIMTQAPARRSIIRGAARARSTARPTSKMPQRKDIDPADTPEQDLNTLELQGLITEIHILGGDAEKLARQAQGVLQRAKPYLTAEQIGDLEAVIAGPIDAWDMVRDFLMSGPVTDEALQDLINQTQGGAA